MRHLILLLLGTLPLAAPAQAWEFRASQICELRHSEAAGDVLVTYDPVSALYAITVTAPQGWPGAPRFGLQFIGPRGGFIATGEHTLSADGRALTVTDTGFGNVLYGLEHNREATAMLGGERITVSLDGAAPEVAKFRACISAPAV